MGNENNTEAIMTHLTSYIETIEDPTFVADIAIAAIMVLVKRLLCAEEK